MARAALGFLANCAPCSQRLCTHIHTPVNPSAQAHVHEKIRPSIILNAALSYSMRNRPPRCMPFPSRACLSIGALAFLFSPATLLSRGNPCLLFSHAQSTLWHATHEGGQHYAFFILHSSFGAEIGDFFDPLGSCGIWGVGSLYGAGLLMFDMNAFLDMNASPPAAYT